MRHIQVRGVLLGCLAMLILMAAAAVCMADSCDYKPVWFDLNVGCCSDDCYAEVIVTGAGSADADGSYVFVGIYNGRPLYVHASRHFYIYYSIDDAAWCIYYDDDASGYYWSDSGPLTPPADDWYDWSAPGDQAPTLSGGELTECEESKSPSDCCGQIPDWAEWKVECSDDCYADVIVTGVEDVAGVNGTYRFVGLYNGRPNYVNDSSQFDIYYDDGWDQWGIFYASHGGGDYYWNDSTGYLTPPATGWYVYSAPGGVDIPMLSGGAAIECPSEQGDVDLDGKIDVLDVRQILSFVRGCANLSMAQQEEADIDGDGDVDLEDARILAEYIVGIRTRLP